MGSILNDIFTLIGDIIATTGSAIWDFLHLVIVPLPPFIFRLVYMFPTNIFVLILLSWLYKSFVVPWLQSKARGTKHVREMLRPNEVVGFTNASRKQWEAIEEAYWQPWYLNIKMFAWMNDSVAYEERHCKVRDNIFRNAAVLFFRYTGFFSYWFVFANFAVIRQTYQLNLVLTIILILLFVFKSLFSFNGIICMFIDPPLNRTGGFTTQRETVTHYYDKKEAKLVPKQKSDDSKERKFS